MSSNDEGKKIGKGMAIAAWILGMVLLTRFFGNWEAQQINPNQNPNSVALNQSTQVILQQNRQHHYLVNGKVNSLPATFMLDTGATDVVIPAGLADTYGLEITGSGIGVTANGVVSLDKTVLHEVSIGDITLYNVRASITPGMDKNQPILLGMSALKQLDLNQQGDTLTLTQTH